MYSLLRNSNRLQLPIDLQIDLFNKTIKPILLYGAEIWGFGNIDVLERVQLKYLKYILKVKRSTPSYMVYGETGCTPLKLEIDEKCITFWSRICSIDENVLPNKLSSLVYRNILSLTLNLNDATLKRNYPWMYNVKPF